MYARISSAWIKKSIIKFSELLYHVTLKDGSLYGLRRNEGKRRRKEREGF